jgi:hypothetical protein
MHSGIITTRLAVRKKSLGSAHSDVATTFSNFELYSAEGCHTEAIQRYSLAMVEKSRDPFYPKVASLLANLAFIYQKTEQGGTADAASVGGCQIRTLSLSINDGL